MTPTQRKAMEQALEALEYLQGIVDTERGPKAADALRAALAEQPAEPVACSICDGSSFITHDDGPRREKNGGKWGRCLHCQPYTAPQPAIPPGYKLADDERVAALCDLSYAAGMKAGWNFCVNDDDAGFERSQSVTGEAMRVLKKHRTMLAASPVKPAEQEPEGSVCGRCGGLVFDPVLPQPAKQPLTDDEIEEINGSLTGRRDLARLFARAIERAHGINVPQAQGETK